MEVLSLCGVLGFCAWEDWKTKEIRVSVILGLAILGLVFHIFAPRLEFWNMVGGIGIGVALYLISILTKEQIGRGDALCFMATGVFLGFWQNLILLWASFTLAGIVGMIYGKATGKTKHVTLPFVPVVFLCLVPQLLLSGGL